MEIEIADRVKALPQYLFVQIEKKVAEKRKRGEDIINLGIGDPDLPTLNFVVEEIIREVQKTESQGYSSSEGEKFFRNAVAEFYKKRFDVQLNPDTEICSLIGSKEGLANISRCLINKGDKALIPNPSYPVYANSIILSDGNPIFMPLLEENDFLPKMPNEQLFDKTNYEINIKNNKHKKSALKNNFHSLYKNAKILYLNYPNNPTGAVADKNFLKKAYEFAKENNTIVCYDNAYSEITFGDYIAPSFLQTDKEKELTIEFNSCSKIFNMTGFRLGFAVGNENLIANLKKIKSQMDSGCPIFIQKAGAIALKNYKRNLIENNLKIYEERFDVLVKGLNDLGFKCKMPKGTFYLWIKVGNSIDFADKLLNANVVATPGIGFGDYGKEYVRFALTQNKERIKEALERLEKIV